MNRKQFFKKLFATTATILIVPDVLVASPKKKISSDKSFVKFAEEFAKKDETLRVYGQPYVIRLKNTSSKTIHDIELFNAHTNTLKPRHGLDVAIDFNQPEESPQYVELLFQSMTQVLNIGLIKAQSKNKKQLYGSWLKINKKFAPFNKPEKTLALFPDFSPYDEKVVASFYINENIPVIIDGQTKVIISKMLPHTEMELFLFPVVRKTKSDSELIFIP